MKAVVKGQGSGSGSHVIQESDSGRNREWKD